MNWHYIEKLYDFNIVNQETRDIEFISNLIIHSFVFIVKVNKNGGLAGIYFNSDKTKNKKLYELNIDDIINIFNLIGCDYPTTTTMIFDTKTGEYMIFYDEKALQVSKFLKLYRNLTQMAITTHSKTDNYLEEIQEEVARLREDKDPRIGKYCDFLLAYAEGKKAEEMKNDIDDFAWQIFENARNCIEQIEK